MNIKDSGVREEFETGAVRDTQEGKGRLDLVPLDCLPGKYADDPVLMSIDRFQRDGNPASIENAVSFFVNQAFENTETAILELACHYEDGAKKYGDNNWKKGLPVSRYISSAVRHYLKYQRGDTDERHDRAVIWNLTAILWTCLYKPEMNDYKDSSKGWKKKMAKFKCPQCGNENINEFSAKPSDGGMLNGGIWNIKCDKCNCQTERFAPVGHKASTKEVIKWIESEDSK